MKKWLNITFDIIFYAVVIIALIGMLAYSANSHRNTEMQYKRDSLEYELLKIEYQSLTNDSI